MEWRFESSHRYHSQWMLARESWNPGWLVRKSKPRESGAVVLRAMPPVRWQEAARSWRGLDTLRVHARGVARAPGASTAANTEASPMFRLIWMLIVGLVVGALARWFYP